MPEDVLKLKRRFDELDVNPDNRNLVLHPTHLEYLILYALKAFKYLTEWKEGRPSRFTGFNILQFTKNPIYDFNTNDKKEVWSSKRTYRHVLFLCICF